MALLNMTNAALDRIYFGCIEPVFVTAGRLLDAAILAPLDFLHVPQFLQLMLIAFLTGLLSLWLRSRVGLGRHEHLFRQSFSAKQLEQEQCLESASDDKAKNIIRHVGDRELDSLYNDYLARGFVEIGITHLLPLLAVCMWLEKIFSAGPGSTMLLFLATYSLPLLLMSQWPRKQIQV